MVKYNYVMVMKATLVMSMTSFGMLRLTQMILSMMMIEELMRNNELI